MVQAPCGVQLLPDGCCQEVCAGSQAELEANSNTEPKMLMVLGSSRITLQQNDVFEAKSPNLFGFRNTERQLGT